MNAHKTFCEICRNDVEYSVSSVKLAGKIKNKKYYYLGKKACCADCGSPVFVPEVNDYNLIALYDVFRAENKIISLDEIKSIPQKYAIGKRPLSLLLGWGEQTFSRYCDGDMPTRQYSNMLKRLFEDPSFYLQILEENKKNLKSDLSYEKSRKAVEKLININSNNDSKIDSVIKYLLNRCEDITPLALQKALYYIQGFYFAFNQTFIFSEDCQAWTHGPVYRDIYFRYRDYRFDPIEKQSKFDTNIFSSEEIAIFDSIVNNICCYSGKILESFTHNESPWLITRGDLPLNEPSERIIDKKLIGDYFSKIKDEYSMQHPTDIKLYSREMFLKIF